MSGWAERAAFATVGGDLVALRGNAGQRRAAGLAACLDDAPPVEFAALLDAPDWLRWPREAQERLARAVGLRSIAPALAGSIDGGWLGALAAVAGEDAIDWAIAKGADGASTGAAPVAPDALAARGFAILGAGLAPALRGYLGWAPRSAPIAADLVAVEEALAFVAAREA